MATSGQTNDSLAGGSLDSFLRKQAWDYFALHASQRMTIFNFYIVLSSVTTTTYAASFKTDSNLQPARVVLAALLCLFALIFGKLDSRTKTLIKNAERALKHFEEVDGPNAVTKVFTQEELETDARQLQGWRMLLFWRWHMSYSDCFNAVFLIFFAIGLVGVIQVALKNLHWIWQLAGSSLMKV